jgi:hypothetical protein
MQQKQQSHQDDNDIITLDWWMKFDYRSARIVYLFSTLYFIILMKQNWSAEADTNTRWAA